MRHFIDLRETNWTPTFRWVADIAEAADVINAPHEDYPHRVEATAFTIEYQYLRPTTKGWLPVGNDRLQRIHTWVFGDEPHAGKWREVRVRVGDHSPPAPDIVPNFMTRLEKAHWLDMGLDELKDWYWDFETIHPFQDGNGRIGGVILASYSHAWSPDQGYLIPEQ